MSTLRLAALVLFCGVAVVSADTRPSFDVASIKKNNSGTGVDRIRRNNASLVIENVSLKRLIFMAFEIPESQHYLFSGPAWLDSENFDVLAKFPVDTPDAKVQLMFQRLLEERFRMTMHREARPFSVLALVPGKGKKDGLKLHPAATPDGAYKFRALRGHAEGSSITMQMLAGRLSRPDFGLNRPVLDFTGMSGSFDLTLDWRPDGVDAPADSDGKSDASILAAIDEQLGLRLEPRKVSLDVLVVDHASKVPIEN